MGRIAPGYAWLAYIFKPLSTTLLVVVAASAPRSDLPRTKWGVVAGLVFSLEGDVFLMLPGDWFLPGLASFLGAHVCYLVAFTSDCRLPARRAPFVAWAIIGLILVSFLWPGIASSLRPAVVLYAVFILAMAAQAAGRALALRTPGAIAAGVGATLFVLSDSLLAINRFHGGLACAGALILGPYFTGQWLIAISTQESKRLICS